MPDNPPTEAVIWVAGGAFLTLLLLVLADIVLTLRNEPPISWWVTQWARRYPVFAIALALVAGGLLGHFFFATNP